jgi:amino acid transporter
MDKRYSLPRSIFQKLWHVIIGRAKDPNDPSIMHHLSLVAFLAWVGLGVDGLSSAAYGPDEAYRTLGGHGYLAIFLTMATVFTVSIISYAYSRLIEHFPHGGGGYVVATQLLGRNAGVVSGCALLVDYVFTITVSIAGGGDAIFSLFPPTLQIYKLPVEISAILILIVMNLRGLKESIRLILPFFLLFLITHIILIVGILGLHVGDLPELASKTTENLRGGVDQFGKWGLFLIFLKAYSMGGGTYTGIEAVSNGVGTLREPRVLTGKRTMLYLAISLSLTAGGLLLSYMLLDVKPIDGQTLNAVLVDKFAGSWQVLGISIGKIFVWVTMFSESILLLIAAQTGFIDGPRVMANMAVDSWLPRRFASLSDRLTMQNGILLLGVAAVTTLVLTGGQIGILVVMYSINVFVTFSLTEMSMMKFWVTSRKKQRHWKRNLCLHSMGFILCFSILCIMVMEKFMDGAWATMIVTGLCIVSCFMIRSHYFRVNKQIRFIDKQIKDIPAIRERESKSKLKIDMDKPTAAILVGGYSKLGRRSFAAILNTFPNTFHNFIFISVGVINSEFFREGGDASQLQTNTDKTLGQYVNVANRLGHPSSSFSRVGMDIVSEAAELCADVAKKFTHVVFFAGELVFDKPRLIDRILHNETAYAIQRQIRFLGLPMVILPIVLKNLEKE